MLPGHFFTGKPLQVAKAIAAGDASAIKSLAAGVNVSQPGDRGMTLLWFAMQPAQPRFEAVRVLVALGVDPDKQSAKGIGTALDFAVMNEDLRYLQAMLDGGLSPNHSSPNKDGLLQRAAGPDGSLAHVKLLIERGAKLDLRDEIGGTALHSAVNARQPEVALLLLQSGAKAGTVKSNGVSVAWSVQNAINRQQPGPMRSAFEQVRDLMIRQGVKFPPEPPPAVAMGS